MKKILVVALLVVIIVGLAYRVDIEKSPHEVMGELMYFPSGYAIRALCMGLHAPLADLVWLRFIQYYGEHRMSDSRFNLMHHILDILTTLDPKFLYAYTLGGLMLTHDAERPDQAKQLLKKGMYQNPDEWRYPHVYAFIHYVFLQDYITAKTYFGIAARKPGAPDMPKRWHAFVTYLKLGDLKTALALWMDFYNETENPEEKSIAEYYVGRIKMQLDIEFLDEKIEEFTAEFGRTPRALSELVTSGLIGSIPDEPHGERYYIENGEARSTWKRAK
ncbi:hypothetical protein IBX73_08935 [candidate division WOR-3 bacterium]|nr:hypothetical protein [candidate division WOR-3 bacterium]